MLRIFRYVEMIADSNETILIVGETGTGKELLAEAVHRASGRTDSFVAVNTAGLDDELFSDTLFGHRKGSYTGAVDHREGLIRSAWGGTLFLDEIGSLSAACQIKLLRLVEKGEYLPIGADQPQIARARLVFASNRDLRHLSAKGLFRTDLYYRLHTHELRIPSLRERRCDIKPLFEHFIEEAAAAFNRNAPAVPSNVFDLLRGYRFPGNVRELRSMVFRAVGRHTDGPLSLDAIREMIRQGEASLSGADVEPQVVFGGRLPTLGEVAELLIDEALERSDGNQSVAAESLGISRQALNKRLKRREGR